MLFQSIGTHAFSERLNLSFTLSIGFLADSALALWISMCYFTTLASAPKRATVFPATKNSLSGRKAFTTPVSSPKTHLTLLPLLLGTTVAETT